MLQTAPSSRSESTPSEIPDPQIDRPSTRPARFITGNITRHVVVMAGTGAVGLMAVFAVDMLNYYYISHLRDPGLTAAIGFAGSINYVQIAISIGLTIGLGAVVGRLIGARKTRKARSYASVFLLVMFTIMAVLGTMTAVFAAPLLRAVGANGRALHEATGFLHIVAPALPLVSLGMAQSALLRTVGDARRSMQVTLVGAFVSAIMDPILIFGFGLELTGAAISTILSRSMVVLVGFLYLRGHHMLELPRRHVFLPASREISRVALPAVATNLATPIGGIFATRSMARFGYEAISGQATIDRIVPVAFAFVFALTGSVGPIISQNLGAGRKDRVKATLVAAFRLTALCVLITWILLAVFQNPIIKIFAAKGLTIGIIRLFCNGLVVSYFFVGLLFVSNTAFNNLNFPLYSTAFNWGRASLGTIPFVYIGAHFGPYGVLIGQALGAVIFGTIAVLTAFRVVNRL